MLTVLKRLNGSSCFLECGYPQLCYVVLVGSLGAADLLCVQKNIHLCFLQVSCISLRKSNQSEWKFHTK